MICFTSNRTHESIIDRLVVQRRVGQSQRYEVMQGVNVLGSAGLHRQRISPVHDLDGHIRIYTRDAPEIAERPMCMLEKVRYIPQFVKTRHPRCELPIEDQSGSWNLVCRKRSSD